ncbi:GNAT family N-acetyltransferase [Methylobacterium sp. ID0610]|uniref:GNAT family N-acetyltransferase n=1 Tax=Methylobacterium carpenticola TaxID=3344827 RepID=UPI00369421DF
MTRPQTIRLKSFELATQDIASVEVQKLHALSIGVGWPHRASDWDMLRALGQGYAALDEIDRVFSTGMWFPHGDGLASIGMVITSLRVQTHGGGRWMMDRILDECGARRLVLNSTRAAVQLYLGLGFVPQAVVYQCQGTVAAERPALPRGEVERMDPADLSDAMALDAEAFGAPRPRLLALLAEASDIDMRGIRRGGRLRGFAMRRAFGRDQVIGPVIAESEADAVTLVAALLEGMEGRFVRLDTRQPEGELRAFLEASGIPLYDTVRTMARGCGLPAVTPGRPGVYGLASQAAG